MKILSAKQLRQADQFTIANEPIASIDLMERAATRCTEWIKNKYTPSQHISIISGNGNNGGDGLAIARLLSNAGYHMDVFIMKFASTSTTDFIQNLSRLDSSLLTDINELHDVQFKPNTLLIDALLGTGVTRPTEGLLKNTIQYINQTTYEVIAIDMPSGLFAEDNAMNHMDGVVCADYTLTFNSPKLAFLLSNNYPFVGAFEVLDIGLDRSFIQTLKTDYFYQEESDVRPLIQARNKFDHKGTFGHALIIAGGKGMMGAAILSARAALKGGAGKVTVHVPQCGHDIMQVAVPEAMVSISSGLDWITDLPKLAGYTSIAIGPGLGQHIETHEVLNELISTNKLPMVIDADALNNLSKHPTWNAQLSAHMLLTPHPGEFERLTKIKSGNYQGLQTQMQFVQKWNCNMLLKGAHSSLAFASGDVCFNSSGNAELATAGSGDVLTGLLAGLLAQGYSIQHASKLAVFYHGRSAEAWSMENEQPLVHMTAADILDYFKIKKGN